MDIGKKFKRMVLEQECAVDPALEHRILNDQLTEMDIAFLTRGWESANSPETHEIARRLLAQGEGDAQTMV